MTNDTLLSVPLFVFMGYIMERAALVDRMFHSVQLAFRRVPASLAVTTLLVCAFWGIASGIVGAVVVLMGVIAMRPMLKAGYDVRLAAGAITAGGTLGILIPPSVMLIVYAAVAGQSIVKLYAAAMLPGFFLTFLYLVYILGWAIINPRSRPSSRPTSTGSPCPSHLRRLERAPRRGAWCRASLAAWRSGPGARPAIGAWSRACSSLSVPVLLTSGSFRATWWYVVVYNAPEARGELPWRRRARPPAWPPRRRRPVAARAKEEKPQELGSAASSERARRRSPRSSALPAIPARGGPRPEGPPEEMTSLREPTAGTGGGQGSRAFLRLVLGVGRGCARSSCSSTTARMDGEQLEILKRAHRLGGAARRAHRGGARGDPLRHLHRHASRRRSARWARMYLAVMARYARPVWWWSLAGALVGFGLGWWKQEPWASWRSPARSGARSWARWCRGSGTARVSPELRRNFKESTFLTAKTTAMVCWLFVGSALFSAVFALHGGQGLIERWVLSHESLAAGVPDPRPGDHLPAGLAAGVDRDHRHLLPDLHPAPEPLPDRSRSCSAPWWR